MSRPPHILVAISSHGFGHLSQIAPVVNQLCAHYPAYAAPQITVRAALPEAQLRSRLQQIDRIQFANDDFGMVMNHALSVDAEASLARYQALHQDWEQRVAALAHEFSAHRIELVLADVPYLPLAAAQLAGIPSVALCSLNWADILSHYLVQPQQREQAHALIDAMYAAYQSARYFLQPAPSMAMPRLTNQRAVGPCCTPGVAQRQALLKGLGVQTAPQAPWCVLVGMGGIPFALSLESWPTHYQGRCIYYLVAPASATTHPTAVSIETLGLAYSDLVASVDLIITKPGYGMFAEAAAAGVPVLFTSRSEWPETEALVSWLRAHAHCAEISPDALHRGDFEQALAKLLAQGPYPAVAPTGNNEAAALIAALIG